MPPQNLSSNFTLNNANYHIAFGAYEGDHEVSGDGNAYTSHFRQYDPRLGRWKTTDPVIHPARSSYEAMDSNPIRYADPLGDNVPFSLNANILNSGASQVTQVATNGAKSFSGLRAAINQIGGKIHSFTSNLNKAEANSKESENIPNNESSESPDSAGPGDNKKTKGNPNKGFLNGNEIQRSMQVAFTFDPGLSPFQLTEVTWFEFGEFIIGSFGKLTIEAKDNSPSLIQGDRIGTNTSLSLGFGFGVPFSLPSFTIGDIEFEVPHKGHSLEEIFASTKFIAIESGSVVLKATEVIGFASDNSTVLWRAQLFGGGIVAGWGGTRFSVDFQPTKHKY